MTKHSIALKVDNHPSNSRTGQYASYMSEGRIDAIGTIIGTDDWRGRKGKKLSADKVRAAKLTNWALLKFVKHKHVTESIPIHNDEWKGFSDAHRKHLMKNVFDCTHKGYSEKDGVTKAWRLKPDIEQELQNMDYQPNKKDKLIDLVTGQTATIKRQPLSGNKK